MSKKDVNDALEPSAARALAGRATALRPSVATQLSRAALIFAMSLALFTTGLWVTGRAGFAVSLSQSAFHGAPTLEPLPGSKSAPAELRAGPSGPEWIQECKSRRAVSEVIADYKRLAERRSTSLPELPAPVFVSDEGPMQIVAWVEPGGRRLGVAAFEVLRGEETRYLLFESASRGTPAPMSGPRSAGLLPMGLELPQGSRSFYDWRSDQQAMCYVEVPGDPDHLLASLESQLRAQGASLDDKNRRVLDANSAGHQMRSLPFENNDSVGALTVRKGERPGTSEISVLMRRR